MEFRVEPHRDRGISGVIRGGPPHVRVTVCLELLVPDTDTIGATVLRLESDLKLLGYRMPVGQRPTWEHANHRTT